MLARAADVMFCPADGRNDSGMSLTVCPGAAALGGGPAAGVAPELPLSLSPPLPQSPALRRFLHHSLLTYTGGLLASGDDPAAGHWPSLERFSPRDF